MYFTRLPNHQLTGFDEQRHFSQFKQHNIIFNAMVSKSYCEAHVGCLSFKTVLSGEEWYGINQHQKAVRPGQFLILNDDQPYSSKIDAEGKVRSLAIFFRKEFASSVFRDVWCSEGALLDNPFESDRKAPEFFQTLYELDSVLQQQLLRLIAKLEMEGYHRDVVDEDLIFLLHQLCRAHQSETHRFTRVKAIKLATRTEIYKRLCLAKDLLHSTFMDKPNLAMLSRVACLSMPQLVRQFKAVFQTTPHHYLTRIRLAHAKELLAHTQRPVHEITLACGFENTSAFCRAFKTVYGIPPLHFRAAK